MYKLFKYFFKKDIESDYDLRLWIDSQTKVSQVQEEAFQRGVAKTKIENEETIQQQAIDLFSKQNWIVNQNHVFQVSKTGIPFLGLEPVTKEVARELQQQARALKDFLVWDVFKNTVKQQAIDLALKTSTSWEHVLPSKMMIHNLTLLDSIITAMDKFNLDNIGEGSGITRPIGK